VRQAVERFDDEDLFVSVVSIAEITKGIALLKESRKKRELQGWLQDLEQGYAHRVLPVDLDTSRIWGELAAAQKAGHALSAGDGLIAACARRHGLHLMTRNVADFQPTGVLLLNPWDDAD
jgi:hypothetical protein